MRPHRPHIGGACTMFYYRDLARAANWYERMLEFERLKTLPGAVVLRVLDKSLLVLVDSVSGSQRPVMGPAKGAILSIETDSLASWSDFLLAKGMPEDALRETYGSGGRTREFKIKDPEDYTIEFFQWVTPVDDGPPGR